MASNVDFQFIEEQEGFKLDGYVPLDKDGNPLGKSGVTIASGFDIGQRSAEDLSGLPKKIQDKLKPYVGLTQEQALKKLKTNPLVLTKQEGKVVNTFAKKEALSKLSRQWKEKTGTDFESLPQNQATPIASVAFQYGDLETKTPNFWNQVTTGKWGEAKKNLANFGDDYGSRRKRELDYLNRPAVKPQEEIVAETQEVVEQRPTGFQQMEQQMFNPFGSNAAYGFNNGGNVMNNKMNTIQVSAPRYSVDEQQERARRSMMHGNYDDRMEDYKYDREYQEDYPYLYPRNTGSYALPQQQAAQRMMGGGMGYAQGGTVNQAQNMASSNQQNQGLSLTPANQNQNQSLAPSTQTTQGLASLGRGGDSTLVHMQPQEVAGLQQLAQANGTSLTTNPMTGYPEAFNLGGMFKSALPILAGYGANAIAPGMGSAIAAGALTGGTVAAMSGDDVLAGTLTGGMGGYSGAGLETALAGSATMPLATSGSNSMMTSLATPTAGMGASGLATGGGAAIDGTVAQAMSPGPVGLSGGVSGAYDQIATNLGTATAEGIVPASGFEVAKTLGAPAVSMGLGGLEVSDFYDDEVEFNDPRDKYDPYSKLNLNKDTGISTALAADTGLRLLAQGGFLEGSGDGMSDDIPAMIDGDQPAALSTGEYVVAADVVSGLGNGSSEAGAKRLHAMMDRVRKATTGRTAQAKEINPSKYMPA